MFLLWAQWLALSHHMTRVKKGSGLFAGLFCSYDSRLWYSLAFCSLRSTALYTSCCTDYKKAAYFCGTYL